MRVSFGRALIAMVGQAVFVMLYYVVGWAFGLASGLAYMDQLNLVNVIVLTDPPIFVVFSLGIVAVVVAWGLTSLM